MSLPVVNLLLTFLSVCFSISHYQMDANNNKLITRIMSIYCVVGPRPIFPQPTGWVRILASRLVGTACVRGVTIISETTVYYWEPIGKWPPKIEW